MKCAPPFFSSRLSNLCWSHYRCARNFDIVKLKLFFTFQSCWIITHILTAFSITFLTQFVKQRPSTPWSFLGLSSNVFTFDHLFTSDLFNNLAISLTKCPEYRKHRCLSSSTNSVRLHFRERVEKIKENGRNTKTENLQNGQEKYCGKKNSRTGTFWAKIKKCHIFFKF